MYYDQKESGKRIAALRKEKGMTQEQLAGKINVSKSTLGRIERGKYNKNVSVSTLLDIADGLRIDMVLLVTFSEQEKKIWWALERENSIDLKDS